MSEFSDSYHLWTDDVGEVRKLLGRAGRYALILGDRGPFVPFIAEPEPGAAPVVEANQGLLIRYDFAEDHGCSLQAFAGVERAGTLEFGQREAPHDVERFAATLVHHGAIDDARAAALIALAAQVPPDGLGDGASDALAAMTGEALALIGLARLRLSSSDLSWMSRKQLALRFPDAVPVNVSKRGKHAQPEPNEWCREPGQPRYMYLPVPDAAHLDERQRAVVRRHTTYWNGGLDWDDDAQAGFWMYEKYREVLPSRYAHLADRMMNTHGWDDLWRCVAAIISVVPADVDWEPTFARAARARLRR